MRLPHEGERSFILSVVQPGLAGLMDGSVSSLAPLFAAAFATRDSRMAFLVGLATAVGAGISMAFSEALSDDGKISGRGNPWVRGPICGAMTFLRRDRAHAAVFDLEFRSGDGDCRGDRGDRAAGHRLGPTSLHGHAAAARRRFQVIVGGAIVFAAGILIGSS